MPWDREADKEDMNFGFDWPAGLLGYESWFGWFFGYKGRKKYSTIDYRALSLPKKLIVQVVLIKPLQLKLLLGLLIALCNSKLWVYVVHGKQVYLQYRGRKGE